MCERLMKTWLLFAFFVLSTQEQKTKKKQARPEQAKLKDTTRADLGTSSSRVGGRQPVCDMSTGSHVYSQNLNGVVVCTTIRPSSCGGRQQLWRKAQLPRFGCSDRNR